MILSIRFSYNWANLMWTTYAQNFYVWKIHLNSFEISNRVKKLKSEKIVFKRIFKT